MACRGCGFRRWRTVIPIEGGQVFQPIRAGVVIGMAMGSGGGFGIETHALGRIRFENRLRLGHGHPCFGSGIAAFLSWLLFPVLDDVFA